MGGMLPVKQLAVPSAVLLAVLPDVLSAVQHVCAAAVVVEDAVSTVIFYIVVSKGVLIVVKTWHHFRRQSAHLVILKIKVVTFLISCKVTM